MLGFEGILLCPALEPMILDLLALVLQQPPGLEAKWTNVIGHDHPIERGTFG
jgi:hypothetical protein